MQAAKASYRGTPDSGILKFALDANVAVEFKLSRTSKTGTIAVTYAGQVTHARIDADELEKVMMEAENDARST